MAERVFSAESLDELIREVMPAPKDMTPIRLRFGGCGIRVHCSTHEIARGLSEYFGEFLGGDDSEPAIEIHVIEGAPPEPGTPLQAKTPDPGKRKIKEEYADLRGGRVVRKRLTGMVFLFSRDRHVAAGPCLANLNQVINFINNRYLQWLLDRGGVLGHAAGIVAGGRGLAIAGFSGMGKSTLSLRLMSRGATFLSNDRVVARMHDGALIMNGVAKHPRVNPGTLISNPDLRGILEPQDREHFESLPAEELWELEQKYDVEIDRHFGPGRFTLEAPMKALVILNWRREGPPFAWERVDLDSRPDLLPAFKKDTGLFFFPPESGRHAGAEDAVYFEILRSCEVYEFTGGVDFEEAARRCEAILEG